MIDPTAAAPPVAALPPTEPNLVTSMLPAWLLPWVPVMLGVALLIAALIVHRFSPEKRPRIRAAVRLFVLYLIAIGGRFVLTHFAASYAVPEIGWIESILGGLIAVLLLTTILFEVLLGRTALNPPKIMTDIAIGVGYLAVFVHALRVSGIALSSIFATSAVASAIIGFSIAPTIGSLLGGIFLQLDRSISEGDWISVDGKFEGLVKAIRWRHTVVETRNWDTILIPNTTLLSANIQVLGRRFGQPLQRRYWVYFNVDHRWSPSAVISVVEEALNASPIPNVAKTPAPNTICMDFNRDGKESFALYATRFWLTNLAADDPTCSSVRERIYAALHRAGIPLALPGTTVFVNQDDEGHKERKKAREVETRVAMLADLELFKPFNHDELHTLANQLISAPFAKGEVLTEQGRIAHWLYILCTGDADVRVATANGQSELVRTIHGPDFFGEMAVMVGAPRFATVIAASPCLCYRLGRDAFSKIITERPEVAKYLAEILARRRVELEAARDRLTEAEKASRMAEKHDEILGQIRQFFGLDV